MMERNELLARQMRLQAEAAELVEELNLQRLLETAGTPVKVGSAALGLMAWRDLDMTVICSKLNITAISSVVTELMSNPRVRQLKWMNDTGDWNTDPVYPDGYYIGLDYQSRRGNEWRLDIWFVDEPEKQPDLQHIRTIPGRLTSEAVVSILSIKAVWASRSEYGKQVKSFDIYTAVLDDQVRTPAEFEQWLQRSQQ
ncbi:hypothetical protein J41TS12_43740 [Paenibacillus antibioticophila]|uniref:Uncharacterized protein n=1 Tax=Paenibacillus antibioticophila TaxID=1274374 RepID=A0A919XZM9_9BACL|nr:hypothetical protein [Paenibacillus antibioticophila]GIO39513.1 hypothetical protein J41TS12_43740 [Paenibacillus antibioticophila]